MSEPACPFRSVAGDRVFHANRHVLALWDAYPVSPSHALIVPKRHIASWFEATAEERRELIDTVELVKAAIQQERHPDGFNVGWNDGAAAGQTVFHLHIHVIPRYRGDVSDPRGGVRHVIPTKAAYWSAGPPAKEQALVRGEDDHFLQHLHKQFDRSTQADLAVAFVSRSGIELLVRHLEDMLSRGGSARIVSILTTMGPLLLKSIPPPGPCLA